MFLCLIGPVPVPWSPESQDGHGGHLGAGLNILSLNCSVALKYLRFSSVGCIDVFELGRASPMESRIP